MANDNIAQKPTLKEGNRISFLSRMESEQMTPITHDECEPEVITRISDLLIKKKKKQRDLLNYLGLHRNNYTEWKKGRSASYLHYIDKIALFLDVFPTYLLRGETEDGLTLSQDEQQLIQMYRILQVDAKEKVLLTVEALVNFDNNASSE